MTRYTVRVIRSDPPKSEWWKHVEPGTAEITDTQTPGWRVLIPGVARAEFIARFLNDVPELLRRAKAEAKP